MASIYPRGKNWWIKYRDPDSGEIDRKPLARWNNGIPVSDRALARMLKNSIENELLSGRSSLPSEIGARDALDRYLAHKRVRHAESTVSVNRYYLSNFLAWGNFRHLSEITERRLGAYIDERLSAGISARTANHTITNVKAWLNWCVRQHLIQINPVQGVSKLPIETPAPRFLEPDDLRFVLERSRHTDLRDIIHVAAYTGMRPSEMQRLDWRDIDLDMRTITVRKSKSKRFRVLPINDRLMDVLETITPRRGPVLEFSDFRKRFDLFRQSLAIGPDGREHLTGITMYQFRHSFASHLAMANEQMRTIADLMGHSVIQTTMIYAHLSPAHRREGVNKLPY